DLRASRRRTAAQMVSERHAGASRGEIPERDIGTAEGLLEWPGSAELVREKLHVLCCYPIKGGRIIEPPADEERSQDIGQDFDAVATAPGREITPGLTEAPGAVIGLDRHYETLPRSHGTQRPHSHRFNLARDENEPHFDKDGADRITASVCVDSLAFEALRRPCRSNLGLNG